MSNRSNPSIRRLLIISCSRRKDESSELLPAWNRYQGGCFPTLRKISSTVGLPDDLDILIISAKYGLMTPDSVTEWYDEKMTAERSRSLRRSVERDLIKKVRGNNYGQTLLILEPQYKECLRWVSLPNPVYLEELNDASFTILEDWILGGSK